MIPPPRRSRVRGRRNPNAARRNPHKPEQRPQSRPSYTHCPHIGKEYDGSKPCSECAGNPPIDCTYIDPNDGSASVFGTKQAMYIPKQATLLGQKNSQDNHDADDRASALDTHEAEDADTEQSGKQPVLPRTATFFVTNRQRFEEQFHSNRKIPVALKDTSASTGPKVALRPLAPMILPAVVQQLPTPSAGNAPQSKSLTAASHEDSRPHTQSQHGHPTVSEDDLINTATGELKMSTRVALVDMIKKLRSSAKANGPPVLPPLNLSIYLLNIYRLEVFFLFPFFNLTIFISAFRSLYGAAAALPPDFYGLGCSEEATPQSPMFHCALFLMLSHATYFSSMKKDHKDFVSRVFWECAMAFVTPHLLRLNSLATVQTFLIIAVSVNSSGSCFPVVERRIPIEMAYRIARHMRVDAEDDGVKRTLEEIEVRRRAWYGCVMMTLYSQSPTNYHLPLRSTVARAPLSADQTPPGSIPFSFFTNCITRCEDLERILKDMPKARSLLCPEEGGKSLFPHMLAELPAMIARFVTALPAAPSWAKAGLPAVDSNAGESDMQTAICNARFVFVRSMLFGPIFMQLGMEECLASGVEPSTVHRMVKDRTFACATSCLNSAVFLLNYMHERSEPVVRSQKAWWWDPYHVSTAGLILVMAQTSALLWTSSDQPTLVKAWGYCQELLVFDKTNVQFNQELLKYLWVVNSGILKGRVLQNNYFITSGLTPARATNGNSNGARTPNMDPSLASVGTSMAPPAMPPSFDGMSYSGNLNSDINPHGKNANFTTLPQSTAAWNSDTAVSPEIMSDNAFLNQLASTLGMDFTQPASASDMPFNQELLAADMAFNEQAFAADMDMISYQGQSASDITPSLPCLDFNLDASNTTSDFEAELMSEIAEVLGSGDQYWGALPDDDWRPLGWEQ